MPVNVKPSWPGDLSHCPLRREVAVEHHEVAVLLDRVRERPDDFLAVGIGRHFAQVLRHRLAGDGQAVAVQQAFIQQRLHERLNAADLYQFRHREPARRTHIRQHRHPIADAGEVIQLQRHASGMGNCEQVQDGVGRTFECHAHGNRILERLEATGCRKA